MRKSISVAHALLPLRYYYQRLSLFFFVLFSVVILGLAVTNNGGLPAVKRLFADMATPVMSFFATPGSALKEAGAELSLFFSVKRENEILREQVEALKKWQAVAYKVHTENESLRGLLKFSSHEAGAVLSTRVSGLTSGAFGKSAIIGAGISDGVKSGMLAVSDEGYIGRVTAANVNSSTVMLITDINSRVPVKVVGSDERFIAAGDNSSTLTPVYTEQHSKLKEGDLVITSGDGNLIREGLNVGTLVRNSTGNLKVKPAASLDNIRILAILEEAG